MGRWCLAHSPVSKWTSEISLFQSISNATPQPRKWEGTACPQGRKQVTYTKWRHTVNKLPLYFLRYTCSKEFNLSWKEQCWLCSVSAELFIRNRPCLRSVCLSETRFSLLEGIIPWLRFTAASLRTVYSFMKYLLRASHIQHWGYLVPVLKELCLRTWFKNQNKWLWKVVSESVQMNVPVQKWCQSWKGDWIRKAVLCSSFTITPRPHRTSYSRCADFLHIKQFSSTMCVPPLSSILALTGISADPTG